MKKTFTIIGYISAGIIALAVVAAAIFIPRALHLERDGAAYISRSLPPIVDGWNPNALIARASPELIATAKPEDLSRLFRYFASLGKLKNFGDPVGTVFTGANTGQGAVTLGNYKMKAEFEGGSAEVSIQLKRIPDGWQINGFHLNSEAFLPK